MPKLRLFLNQSPSSFKAQFKKADKSSAQFAIIVGENEINNNIFTLKSLINKEFGQKELSFDDLVDTLDQYK